jgi:hypothetical protein
VDGLEVSRIFRIYEELAEEMERESEEKEKGY